MSLFGRSWSEKLPAGYNKIAYTSLFYATVLPYVMTDRTTESYLKFCQTFSVLQQHKLSFVWHGLFSSGGKKQTVYVLSLLKWHHFKKSFHLKKTKTKSSHSIAADTCFLFALSPVRLLGFVKAKPDCSSLIWMWKILKKLFSGSLNCLAPILYWNSYSLFVLNKAFVVVGPKPEANFVCWIARENAILPHCTQNRFCKPEQYLKAVIPKNSEI